MLIIYSILIICVWIAAIYDAITHKIPNWTSSLIIVSGLAWNIWSNEGLGARDSSVGLIAGLLVMLPGYVFASMGAGDVKLMAAIGSVVGIGQVIDVALYSYMVMFLMALAFVVIKGDLSKLLFRYKAFFYGLLVGMRSYQEPEKGEAASCRLALAPAIALSTCYVLYPKLCNPEFINNLCHYLNS